MTRATPYDRDTALGAAMALFWSKGYHATSLKDLEATLQMKPGSIYAAFTSKENLYLLTLERYFDASRAALRAQLAKAASPLEGLAAQFRAFAALPEEAAARQACMLMKTLLDTRSTDPEIAGRTSGYLDAMRQEFAAAFDQAKAQGEIAADLDSARLARRYQANLAALRFELHQRAGAEEVTLLAEDMAQELLRLRVSPA